MAGINELIMAVPAITAAFSFIIHCWMLKVSDSGLFAYGLIVSAAIAISSLAIALAPADLVGQAAADLGIMVAGAMAFAASGWLLFAFRVAGGTGDR